MVSTRERMIASTALLVRERGSRATSIDDVLAHSGAPRGSVYHHFPGGRTQLFGEAIDYAGEYVAARIAASPTSVAVLDTLVGDYRDQLVRSEFRAGCPVVAVAVEADSDLHEQAAAAFSRWGELLAERLVADGVAEPRALEIAVVAIAALEGALVLARARRDVNPLDVVHRELRATLRSELGSTAE